MIFKININIETLEAIIDDPDIVINHIKNQNGVLEIEVSKKDPEMTEYGANFATWQQ